MRRLILCALILRVYIVLVTKNTSSLAVSLSNRTIYLHLRPLEPISGERQNRISNDHQLANAIARYHGVFGIGNANEDETITSQALIIRVREQQGLETNVTLDFPLPLPQVKNDPEVVNTAR